MIWLLMLFVLLGASVQDLLYREVNDVYWFALFMMGVVLTQHTILNMVLGLLLFLLIGFVLFYKNIWGAGDGKIFAALGGVIALQMPQMLIFLFFVGASMIIKSLVFKRGTQVPFLPFIMMSFLSMMIYYRMF